jgi:hypothetical protein
LSKKVSRKKRRLLQKILDGTKTMKPKELLKIASWIGLEIREGAGDHKVVYAKGRKESRMVIDMGQKELLPAYIQEFRRKFRPEILSFLGS